MSESNHFFIGPLETKELSSDEGDCMEDTFRPSLFQRIDSCSSLQSAEYENNYLHEQSIPQINISSLTQKEDKEAWDVSMLYSVEHEKNLELDFKLKNNKDKLEIAERKEKRIIDQLEEAKGKTKLLNEQYLIETDYLKTKIDFLENKYKELENKYQQLEEKKAAMGKDMLLKDKKIVWLENEIFAKEIRLKSLADLEKEVETFKGYKENCDLLKEKLMTVENQLSANKKENRDYQSEISKLTSKYNSDISRINQDKDKAERMLEIQRLVSEKNGDEVKNLQNLIRKMENDAAVQEAKIKAIEKKFSDILNE